MINIESPLHGCKSALQSRKGSMIDAYLKESAEDENDRHSAKEGLAQIQFVDAITFDDRYVESKISKTTRHNKKPPK